jgi:hypothetical protein
MGCARRQTGGYYARCRSPIGLELALGVERGRSFARMPPLYHLPPIRAKLTPARNYGITERPGVIIASITAARPSLSWIVRIESPAVAAPSAP